MPGKHWIYDDCCKYIAVITPVHPFGCTNKMRSTHQFMAFITSSWHMIILAKYQTDQRISPYNQLTHSSMRYCVQLYCGRFSDDSQGVYTFHNCKVYDLGYQITKRLLIVERTVKWFRTNCMALAYSTRVIYGIRPFSWMVVWIYFKCSHSPECVRFFFFKKKEKNSIFFNIWIAIFKLAPR